jgi:hypothetical protein
MFSLRTLILATALIALYFGLRTSFVLGPDFGSDADSRAHIAVAVMGAVASIWTCVQSASRKSRWQLFARSIAAAVFVEVIAATALGAEMAERFGRSYPEYFNWYRDGIGFLLMIWRMHVFIGLVIGTSVAAFFTVAIPRAPLSQQARPAGSNAQAGLGRSGNTS